MFLVPSPFHAGEGLITYMRTDGVQMSDVAVTELRNSISTSCGPEYLPDQRRCVGARKWGGGEVGEQDCYDWGNIA